MSWRFLLVAGLIVGCTTPQQAAPTTVEPAVTTTTAAPVSTSVPAQTWGVTAGVPDSWTVAQKNGFAGQIINSAGWVDPPNEDEGYLVAILTYGWPNHPAGIEADERISLLVANSMIDTVPRAE